MCGSFSAAHPARLSGRAVARPIAKPPQSLPTLPVSGSTERRMLLLARERAGSTVVVALPA
jgi:hypothetical protein